MIALLIGYEAVSRFLAPVPIRFTEAIPIAVLGLIVNFISAWLLRSEDHHGHGHGRSHFAHDPESQSQRLITATGSAELSIFEDGVPPRFRLRFSEPRSVRVLSLETVRSDGRRQVFSFENRGDFGNPSRRSRNPTHSPP
jgi:Co/Zn/Cd efflux system component